MQKSKNTANDELTEEQEERLSKHMEISRYLVNYGVVGIPFIILFIYIIFELSGC